MQVENFAINPQSETQKIETQEIKMKNLPRFCFVAASITALVGMSLGIYMGIADDYTLRPVHAHLNLLGWVTLFLFGLYYRSHEHAQGRMAVLQVSASTVGYLSMLAGLAAKLLTDEEIFLPIVIVGSILVWLGMLMFLTIVWQTRMHR